MPELPEVETIRRGLQRHVVKKRIVGVKVRLAKMVSVGPDPVPQIRRTLPIVVRQFSRILRGATVIAVRRRAKLLMIEISSGWTVLVHLKMSGQLIVESKSDRLGLVRLLREPVRAIGRLPAAMTHVIINFSDGSTLFYNDVRQFGYLKAVRNDEVPLVLAKAAYGPEPLESQFTYHKFLEIIKQLPQAPVKRVLLDQQRIAGLGNIYADEACFRARIKPTRKAGTLTATELRGLYRGIRTVLRLGIQHAGTSVGDYYNVHGQPGEMAKYLNVYGRSGKTCPRRDGGRIKRLTFLGRGTHFCPVCQR